MKKVIIIILTIFLSIVIILGGATVYLYYLKEIGNTKEIAQTDAKVMVTPTSTPVPTPVPTPKDTSIAGKYNHDEYQEKIEQIGDEHGTVGIAVALVENGKVIDTFCDGYAIKGELEMDEEVKLRIASVSKVFVGLATMISVEDGTMNLDEDIGTYWGFEIGTRDSDDVITPRALLTHTSSLYDTEDVSETYYNAMAYRLRSGSGIRNIASGNIENYMYNNYAMDVLGMTVEIANGETLDEILRDRLYDDMNIDAAFYPGDLQDSSNLASIYQYDGSCEMPASRLRSWHSGAPGSVGWGFAGGIAISINDLGKIVALISNDGVYDGKRYLSENSIKEIENHKNNNTGEFWQCQPLCYENDLFGQKEIYYHHGRAYGLFSIIAYNPENKQGVAVVTTGSSSEKICDEIAEVLLNIKVK